MWYLIVSIPDLCTLTYFERNFVKDDLMSRIMLSIYFPLASRCSFWVMLFSGLIMLVLFWLDFFSFYHLFPQSIDFAS